MIEKGKSTGGRTGAGNQVISGDHVYFRHAKHGALSGKVCAVGEHGCTIEHETGEGGRHKVLWDDVLGHKERRVRKLEVVDRGEDGGIAVDEDGKRHFLEGELPHPDEQDHENMGKAFSPPDAPILIDIGHLHGDCCDHALEGLHKAISDEDGIAHDIWAIHENPFIRNLIEKFSDRGMSKLGKVQSELQDWLNGLHYVPSKDVPMPPPGYMGRWTREELDLVRIYLENVPPEAMTIDDWSLAVDYMVQRYLPPEALNEEAEWLSTKSYLMGKVQSHLTDAVVELADQVADMLPATVNEAVHMFGLSDATRQILDYGKAHACESVTSISETARHRLKSVILDYQRARLAGEPVSTSTLQQALLDKFDGLNKDWRRIAITEAGDMAGNGVIASLPVGSSVRRIEMYSGACPFCKKINGRVFRVVDAADPDKDGEKDVWVGKTNLLRSASPMKREGSGLVPRAAEERWWVPAGTVHPHCRGRWEPMAPPQPGDDPDFGAWLRAKLGQERGMPE